MISFAILLCTHNGARHLATQLQSIAAQKHNPVVLFIHDWNSQDKTCEIIEDFSRKNTSQFKIILYRHSEAPGACGSFMAGINHCLESEIFFEYLALCDQDDIWHTDKLSSYAQSLSKANQPPSFIFSNVCLIDGNNNIVEHDFYGTRSPFAAPENLLDAGLLLVNPVIGMTLAVSRSTLYQCAKSFAGPWLMHDWAIVLIAMSSGGRSLYIPKPLVSYRQHDENILGAAQGMRLWHRVHKAHSHFERLRLQAENMDPSTVSRLGSSAITLLHRNPTQRLKVAWLALKTKLLKPQSRIFLAIGIIIFW